MTDRASSPKGLASASTSPSLRRRLRLCAVLAALPAAPIACRLAYLHVYQGDRLKGLATRAFVREREEPVLRGRILDARGRVLAESVPAWSVYADPGMIKSPWVAAKRLSPILGLGEAELRVKLRGKGRFVWLKRKLPMRDAGRVRELDLPGIALLPEEERQYPNGDLARNVLGAVGSEGEGLSGVEHAYNSDLDGEHRRLKLLIDGAGVAVQREDEGSGRPPGDLQLTIDASIQYFAEQALRSALERTQAASGVALVQDPRTGDLLAMASLPISPMKNPAVQDAFEPGSTIKFLTAVAAVEEKAVAPNEAFDCENGKWEPFPGIVVRDHKGYGALTLAGILQHSSNIGMAKIAQRLGVETFHQYATLFGLGLKTGVGLPGEPSGSLPRPQNMRPINLVTASYGYGLALNAVQLVTAYSAIANGGTLYQPKIVRAISSRGRKPVKAEPPIPLRRVASERTIEIVRDMLVDVVKEGTGQGAGIAGYDVAGKTGTSKKLDPETRKYAPGSYMASFCGLVPARQPKFVILVVLDQPQGAYYGGEVAAPVFAEIAREILAYRGTPRERAAMGTAR